MNLALDLFCCAGGVAKGLTDAGWYVVGVDIEHQPRYPYAFVQADVMNLEFHNFGLVWASPPCQGYSDMQHAPGAKETPRLIEPVRSKLIRAKTRYVIENVEGAPLVDPIVLCGSMFGLGAQDCQLRRHRLFECNFPVEQPTCRHDDRPVIGVYGGHARKRSAAAGGRGTRDVWEGGHRAAAQEAMAIDWMTLNEMSQAIPPAFAEHIGRAALRSISVTSGKQVSEA
jgi:DNA (cytosine-5)-methyltransferase 1